MAPVEVIHAYRLLYRRLLQAVQYSKPARFTARDQLRRAFREERPSAGEAGLDTEGIKRTVWFLEAAARERGMEHRILRALLRTAYERDLAGRRSWKTVTSKLKTGSKQSPVDEYVERTAYGHYDMTVAMLNKTMGTCLR